VKRVTGIGGIFFKAENPGKLYKWYEEHLGIKSEPNGAGAMLHWREDDNPERRGMTIWSLFDKNTKYFEPSRAPFMLNYRVEDLDALLALLRAEGVEVDPKREVYDYGRFAWITDPEGNKIELWEPPKDGA
jgi:predicted enzyme related to lactoylglutathione lyase